MNRKAYIIRKVSESSADGSAPGSGPGGQEFKSPLSDNCFFIMTSFFPSQSCEGFFILIVFSQALK